MDTRRDDFLKQLGQFSNDPDVMAFGPVLYDRFGRRPDISIPELRDFIRNYAKTHPMSGDDVRAIYRFLRSEHGLEALNPNIRRDEHGFWRDLKDVFNRVPDYHANLGKGYAQNGDWAAAGLSYNRAIELGQRTPETLNGRGLAAERLKDFELAHKDAGAALALDPNNQTALALYKLTEARPSQFNLLGQAAAPKRDDHEAARPKQSPVDAAAFAQAASRPNPSDPLRESVDWARRSGAALQVGDLASARSAADRSIALNPNNAQALNYRATANLRDGKYAASVGDASSALAIHSTSIPALNTRSRAYSRLGQYNEALLDATNAVQYMPNEAISHYNRAFALGGLGDRKGMLAELAEAARLNPAFESAYRQALQLPDSKDMTLLFSDDRISRPDAEPSRRGSSRNRYLTLILSSLVGGFMLAAGILSLASSERRSRISQIFAGRRDETKSGAATGKRSRSRSGGFWERYSMIRPIGSGGMGVVYEGKDNGLDRKVAIKKMRGEVKSDPKSLERFLKEARTVASLHHPNIVEIHSIEEAEDVFLVFEFVEGETLRELMQADKPMSLEAAARIFRDVCGALEYAHKKGIIHRDLTPSNIMITDDGRAKVMDFGVARAMKDAVSRLSQTGTACGTPPYMAPEQEHGQAFPQSDIFSLGVCLYHTLTGKLPFEGTPSAALLKKMEGKYVPPSLLSSELPNKIDAFFAKVLAPDPEERMKTPAEFKRELDALLIPETTG
ncbi:MAG: protein kinase [Elusimicrobia bacterium]|nr:protein kinase [Elusimicrobiota bacterium]